MNFEFMANLWFILVTLVWAIYFAQEFFISGVGMLSMLYINKEDDFRYLNTSVGTFWDGIQVWLILAIGGTFAAFPHAFASIFTALYIPVFLLLYVIIFRGLSIELIYKSNNTRVQNILKRIWIVSSFLLVFVLGLYTINLFIGLPNDIDGVNKSFFSFMFIFNKVALLGAITFVLLSLSIGILYIKLNAPSSISKRLDKISKTIPIITMFCFIFLFVGLNTKGLIFEREVFLNFPLLWIMPISALIIIVLSTLFAYLNKNIIAFIFIILGIVLLVFSGYVALMPNFVFSSIDPKYSLTILDASAKLPTLIVMFYSLLIFLPIVIGYQGYKYYRFWRK